MNKTGKGYFQKGNELGQGGVREGAGRLLQPTRAQTLKMKKYLGRLLTSDIKLMCRLEWRPEEFADQVQFGGSETDEQADGKTSQKRSGGYFLDPIFKARLELLKFRLTKYTTGAPKEIDVNVDVNPLWTILKELPTYNCNDPLPIPSSSANGSSTHLLSNGNGTHSESSPKVVELPVQSVTVAEKQDSLPSQESGSWSHAKNQE